MAAEIKEKFGLDAELIPGKGGIFDVHADGQLLYSKKEQNDQLPKNNQVIEPLLELQAK